jgi:hypothetical protein
MGPVKPVCAAGLKDLKTTICTFLIKGQLRRDERTSKTALKHAKS